MIFFVFFAVYESNLEKRGVVFFAHHAQLFLRLYLTRTQIIIHHMYINTEINCNVMEIIKNVILSVFGSRC
jgi:hypothetical protein